MASRTFCTKQSFTLVRSSFTARRQEIRDRLLTKWFHGQWLGRKRNMKYVDCLFNFDNQKYSNFWQPEIFQFLTTWNIWIFDNLKYLNVYNQNVWIMAPTWTSRSNMGVCQVENIRFIACLYHLYWNHLKFYTQNKF